MYEKNKEVILSRQKAYYDKNKEKMVERGKQYYQSNKEKVNQLHKKWVENHKQEVAEYQKKYREGNKDKLHLTARIRTVKRRVKKKGQTPDLTKEDSYKVTLLYKIREKVTKQTGVLMHVDHIIPIAKGGLHHPLNLQVITAEENHKKFDKMPENIPVGLLQLHKEFYIDKVKGLPWE